MLYISTYLSEAVQIIQQLDKPMLERMVHLLSDARACGGRLFILGVGGGAAHAAHAVCDFRKIVGIEAYAPSENVAELTARVNDEGWDTVFSAWLATSQLNGKDVVLVFSVGGGDLERGISSNLVRGLEYALQVGATIIGIVGRDGGYTARVADACLIIPTVNPRTVTAHTESFQAVLLHLLVSHPELKTAGMKWESLTEA